MFSDLAIETALTLRPVFRFALRFPESLLIRDSGQFGSRALRDCEYPASGRHSDCSISAPEAPVVTSLGFAPGAAPACSCIGVPDRLVA